MFLILMLTSYNLSRTNLIWRGGSNPRCHIWMSQFKIRSFCGHKHSLCDILGDCLYCERNPVTWIITQGMKLLRANMYCMSTIYMVAYWSLYSLIYWISLINVRGRHHYPHLIPEKAAAWHFRNRSKVARLERWSWDLNGAVWLQSSCSFSCLTLSVEDWHSGGSEF